MIDPLVIPIAGIALPVVLVPVILGMRHARRERELEHAERIKALELGRTLPRDESFWTLPRIAVAIGAGVPAAVFFCAWQATQGHPRDPFFVWGAACVVGTTAVIRGSSMAARHFLRRDDPSPFETDPRAKASFDPDAYDVVSSRG
jgi:hypothetical protein